MSIPDHATEKPAREVAALALASLPEVSPHRLTVALGAFGDDPEACLAAIEAGSIADVLAAGGVRHAKRVGARWHAGAAQVVARAAAQIAARRPLVWMANDRDAPIREPLPDRPPILFGEGARADAFEAPRIAIVGTRAATPHGIDDAAELGGWCARAGFTVVSGLAIGVDAAAHEGAIAAGGRVVGVVATGLDVVYPRRHSTLYAKVREAGAIVSEHGYGVQPHPQRFPVRNRIIAALADAVIVVEATVTGGARITARLAADYGRDVYALPGSRRNPSAAGCNALLYDGAKMLLEPGDVLSSFGALGTVEGGWEETLPPPTHPDDAIVLRALAGDPATIDQIERHAALPAPRLGAALRRLEQSGHVERRRGLFWPR